MFRALLVALFFLSAQAADAAAEKWTDFKTPKGDVTVSAPAVFTDKTDKSNWAGLETYIAKSQTGLFLVTTIPNSFSQPFAEAVDGYKDGIKVRDKKATFSSIQKVKGAGWQGEQSICTLADGKKQATLCAMDDGGQQFVTVATSLPMADANAQKFFKSVKIDPVAAKARVEGWKAASTARVAKDTSWKPFVVPKGDVTVSVPAEMVSTSKGGLAETYGTVKKEDIIRLGTAYSVTITPNVMNESFDKLVAQAKAALSKQGYKELTKDVKVTGPGWKGVQMTYAMMKSRNSFQISTDSGGKIFVSQNSVSMLNDPRTQRYFKSLKIDSAKAKVRCESTIAELKKAAIAAKAAAAAKGAVPGTPANAPAKGQKEASAK